MLDADRRALARAAAGADAEVRLRLLERRGSDASSGRPRARSSACSTARSARCRGSSTARGRLRAWRSRSASSGCPVVGEDDALHARSTRTDAARVRQGERRAWRTIADERLDRLAAVVWAKKITPAAIRVVDVPGTGRALLGDLRQVDALLVVARRRSPARATRRATSRRSGSSCSSPTATTSSGGWSGSSKQAKSGDAGAARRRRRSCERLLAHLDDGTDAARLAGRAPARARAADDEAAARGRERAGGIDLELEAELSELSDEEAAEFRDGARRRSTRSSRRLSRRARPDHVLHRRREGDARVDAAPRRDGARRRRDDPLRHRARLHPRRGDRLRTTWSRRARTRKPPGAALQRLEGKTYVVQDGDVLNIRFNV